MSNLKLNFQLLKSGTSSNLGLGARLGILTLEDKLKVSTPNCTLNTKTGNLIPHLLNEVKDELNLENNKGGLLNHPINYYLNEAGIIKFCKSEKKNLRELTNSQKETTLLTLFEVESLKYNSDLSQLPYLKAGQKFLSIPSSLGNCKTTLSQFEGVLRQLQPEVFINLYDALPNFELDYPTQATASLAEKRMEKSVNRTGSWLVDMMHTEFIKNDQSQIVVPLIGSDLEKLRTKSVQNSLPFVEKTAGYLITNFNGNLEKTLTQLRHTVKLLNEDSMATSKPRFSFDFVDPVSILKAVECGVDVFDTTYPILAANHGFALAFSTLNHTHTNNPNAPNLLDLNRPTSDYISPYQTDLNPIYANQKSCSCYTCTNQFSRAYLVHLLNTKEMLAYTLLTSHNVQVYLDFFKSIRLSIEKDTFDVDKENFLKRYETTEWFPFVKK